MKKKSIRTLTDLAQNALINKNDLPILEKVANHFSVAITKDMHDLIDKNNVHDPILKQFIPSIDEINFTASERLDPIGDDDHKKLRGIVHRYPDRCLFTPVHICPVYCRFCFRKEKVGKSHETLTPSEMDAALHYIENQKTIWEVILTGGDPLILKPTALKNIFERLSQIPHIEIIRIHTRIPIVESERIDDALIAAIKTNKTLYIALHANHPKEFTDKARNACAKIVDAGIPMISQTVLLKDINDNIATLSELMRIFLKNRIKPYYLHHPDLARGTKHFRVSIAKGQALVKALRGRFSGLCQPTYVIDIPGGFGKVPIAPNYMSEEEVGAYIIEDYQGKKHYYPNEE